MTKYITQAENTTADEFMQRIRELKEKITRRNKQIKALKKKLSDILNTEINAHVQKQIISHRNPE